MELKRWVQMWDSNKLGFHKAETHPDLKKHEQLFLQEKSRVYLPLCGKSLDLVYLADKGHDVYGCEFVEKGVKDFFKELDLEYTVSSSNTAVNVYKAISKQIALYQGDFFALSSNVIGKFDAIWDRGSLVAIDPCQRKDYAKVILDIMTPKCKYLLNTFVITGEHYQGPPFTVTEKDIYDMFGDFCDISFLDNTLANSGFTSVTKFEVENRLISLKQHP